MEKKHSRLALVLMAWVLLLVLALGPLAPGAFAREAGLQAGFVVPCYYDGGGSGT
ncbi:MAG: hypothetical protein KAX24_11730 [Anaerolineae bacterium]|nr:hypothetical protein [Anaerolineae bacterium]